MEFPFLRSHQNLHWVNIEWPKSTDGNQHLIHGSNTEGLFKNPCIMCVILFRNIETWLPDGDLAWDSYATTVTGTSGRSLDRPLQDKTHF